MKAKLKLGGKYKIGKKLGAGAFGEVFMAQDISNGELVAVKVEDNLKVKHPQLFHEARLLKALKGKGIPELKGALIEGDYNIMIINLLGSSLEDLFSKCRRKFSIQTIANFALQALDRINHCFTNEYLHRDIKPDNFMIGNKDPDTLYL